MAYRSFPSDIKERCADLFVLTRLKLVSLSVDYGQVHRLRYSVSTTSFSGMIDPFLYHFGEIKKLSKQPIHKHAEVDNGTIRHRERVSD